MKDRSGSERTMVTPGYEHQSSQPTGGQHQDAALAIAASQPIPPHDAQYPDQAQFEADKRAVYKHPLFPLLALLFEKCELATQTAADTPISDSFHHDLEAFVQHQERDRKPFLANDPEVDGLMIKAIQVLRIHLLELDKVQELCKDFCNRYITCLKGKMQSENLLRSDYYDSNNGGAHLSSHSNSPHHSFSSNGDASVSPPNNGVFHLQNVGGIAPSYHPHLAPNNLNSSNQVNLGHVSPEHNSSNSSNHLPPPPAGIHGGTPLSQIGANTCPPPSSQDSFVQTPPTPSSVEDDDDYLGRKKPKRGVLPKHATSIMRSWLFQHIVHPYPTEDEKRQIADASNPETSATPKVKKIKNHGSKPALKYWSDNLASIGSGQLEPSDGINGLDQHGGDSSEESDDSSNDGNDLLIDNSDSSQQGKKPAESINRESIAHIFAGRGKKIQRGNVRALNFLKSISKACSGKVNRISHYFIVTEGE
ncbi:unnamed protein product [Allacma fusca]|uniref:MEIS N-terminal domain-containing protein n=1 Tax=Allacma fusca TaxID=39272 RepID=A0A8J2JMC0_9HEXA|nr:unnamed protein product [Allacma fusca]